MRLVHASLLAVAALAAGAAFAERSDREKEIVVGADRLTADDARRTSTFDGNVVISQGTMRITADRVTVREDAQRHKYYVATGNPVTFRQKRDKVDEWVEGFAQRAEFDDRSEVLKLYDGARVKSEANEITGDYISYDMRNAVTSVEGSQPGKAAPGSRVKMVILPPKKPREGEKAEPPAASGTGVPLKTDPGKR